MSNKGVCRTAPATPGLLITRNLIKVFVFIGQYLFNKGFFLSDFSSIIDMNKLRVGLVNFIKEYDEDNIIT